MSRFRRVASIHFLQPFLVLGLFPLYGFVYPMEATLEFDKAEYVLGETVVMHFCMENSGDKTFDVVIVRGSGGNHQTPRFRVEVTGTNVHGQRLRDPNIVKRYKKSRLIKEHPFFEKQEMPPGEEWCQRLLLHRAVHIDQPGIYEIEAYHNFGDGVSKPPLTSSPRAFRHIQFHVPSAEQARVLVEKAFELPDSDFDTPFYVHDEKFESPFIDLAAFSHPIFLPLLKEKAQSGDTRALEGISAIKTPEATEVLLEFLTSQHPGIVDTAWSALAQRFPDPHILGQAASKPPVSQYYLDRKGEIDITWRAEFVPTIRSYIPKFLDSSDDKLRFYGARIMYTFPEPSDVPLFSKALTQALHEYEKPLSRGRQTVTALISAGFSLAQFQEAMPQTPETDGEIALYIVALKWDNQSKRKVGLRGLEEKVEMWRNHPSKVIRKLITGGSW